MVNGYEDLYLPMKNLDKTHIWIIWAMRNLLNKFTKSGDLQFDKNLMLKPDVYKKLNQEFNFLYWENIKKNRNEKTRQLEKFWDNETKNFDSSKLWKHFEEQLDYIENKLKNSINGNLCNEKM